MLNPNFEPRQEPHDDPLPELRRIAADKLADLERHWEGYVASKRHHALRTRTFFEKLKKVGPSALKPGPDVRNLAIDSGRMSDWLRVTLEIAAEIALYDPGYHTEAEGLARVERLVVLAHSVGKLENLLPSVRKRTGPGLTAEKSADGSSGQGPEPRTQGGVSAA
jgi:hypothetical protein